MSTSKSYESKADLTEKWYGVKYSRELFPDECIKKWTNCEIHPDLKLPLPNSYIPTKFDLKPREEEKGIIPKVLADTGLSKIWFLQDNEFLMPKAVARVELYSSLPMLDPKHTNLNTMFVMVIKDLLTEESYAANAAGLSYAVSPSVYGVEAVAHGYDDKMGVLMKRVIETITNFSCTQDRFDVLKDTYYRQLKNFSDEQPYSHSMYYLAYLLREKRWLHHELMDAMKAVTLESLTRYANDFLENLRLEWLLCGNLTPTEAEGLVKSCEDCFKTKGTQPYLPSQVIRLRELKLNTGNYLYKNTHATHTSSCCLAFYEIGMLKMKESLVLEMLDHIANEPCFTQLRTQEQLGYIVFSGVRKSAAIEGLQILVQSDRHCAYVDSRIEDFLTNLDTILKNMTEEEFLQHRAGLSTRKSEKPKKLKDRQNIIWSEINTHLYEFDRQRIELIELEKVTLDEVIALFDSLVSPLAEKRKRLGIHVLSTANVGAGSKPNEADQAIIEEVEKKADIIQDPHFWKQTMKLWPLRMPSFLNKAKL
jgi:insulysin